MARREKGEGSLYQAKDKSWVYQYIVDGKRKTKRFRRKADAKAFVEVLSAGPTEVVIEKPSAGPRQVDPITVGEWMDRWLEKYAKPTVKLSTYCSYEQLIRSHVKPQIGGRYMNTMTGEDLQDFFNERRTQGNQRRGGGLSTKTLTNLRNDLGVFYTNEAGEIVLEHIDTGWYRIRELESAPGFTIKAPDTQDIYLKAGEIHEVQFLL